MTNADIPYMISDALMGISDNPLIILLLINIVLLIVGIFMDMTPAVLIFTPISCRLHKSWEWTQYISVL